MNLFGKITVGLCVLIVGEILLAAGGITDENLPSAYINLVYDTLRELAKSLGAWMYTMLSDFIEWLRDFLTRIFDLIWPVLERYWLIVWKYATIAFILSYDYLSEFLPTIPMWVQQLLACLCGVGLIWASICYWDNRQHQRTKHQDTKKDHDDQKTNGVDATNGVNESSPSPRRRRLKTDEA